MSNDLTLNLIRLRELSQKEKDKLKCLSVIKSCKNLDQLKVAKEFCQNYINFYRCSSMIELASISNQLMCKRMEIETKC